MKMKKIIETGNYDELFESLGFVKLDEYDWYKIYNDFSKFSIVLEADNTFTLYGTDNHLIRDNMSLNDVLLFNRSLSPKKEIPFLYIIISNKRRKGVEAKCRSNRNFLFMIVKPTKESAISYIKNKVKDFLEKEGKLSLRWKDINFEDIEFRIQDNNNSKKYKRTHLDVRKGTDIKLNN